MADQSQILNKLADKREVIQLHDLSFPVKGPGEFRLVPLTRILLLISQISELLQLTPPEVSHAEDLLDRVLKRISRKLYGDAVFSELKIEEKLDILEIFNRLGQQLSSEEMAPEPADENAQPAEPTDWFKVIPRLQKFYGGAPLDWFNLKMKWLVAFNGEMEKLKAEHILDLSKASLAGTWPQSEEQKDAIEELTGRLQSIMEGSNNRDQTQDEIIESLNKIPGFHARRVEADA